jgi:hypothetical protein
MTYGDRDSVRKLAGNPPTTDVSDADIDLCIAHSDSRVELETAHAGWLSGDQGYPAVQEASNYFASSETRDRYADPEHQADKHYQKALDICDAISKGSSLSILTFATDFQTYPLNPDKPIYRSLPSSGSTEKEPFI